MAEKKLIITDKGKEKEITADDLLTLIQKMAQDIEDLKTEVAKIQGKVRSRRIANVKARL